MDCNECIHIFSSMGDAFNSPIATPQFLEETAQAIVDRMHIKGCHFRLLSRDQKILEHVAAHGLSEEFLSKGPVDAEKSVAEALQGKTVLISDCANDPRIQYPSAHIKEGIVSTLIVPLSTRGQVIGTMRLSLDEQREFTGLEVKIAEVVASFVTRAITHSMFQAISRHLTSSIRTSLDLDRILESTVKIVSEDLRAKGCTIHLFGARDDSLRLRASYGLSDPFLNNQLARIVQRVVEGLDGECVQIFSPDDDIRIASPDAVRFEGIASQLYVPLVVRDKSLGVMGVFTHHPYLFSNDEIYFMKAMGDQCALAIQNAQMYDTLKGQYENLMNDFQFWFANKER